jgi:gas vesicle protein
MKRRDVYDRDRTTEDALEKQGHFLNLHDLRELQCKCYQECLKLAKVLQFDASDKNKVHDFQKHLALLVDMETLGQRRDALVGMTQLNLTLEPYSGKVTYTPGREKTVRMGAPDIPIPPLLGGLLWLGKNLFKNHLAKEKDSQGYWFGIRGQQAMPDTFSDWVQKISKKLCGKSLGPADFRRIFFTQLAKKAPKGAQQHRHQEFFVNIARLQNTSVQIINTYYNRANYSELNQQTVVECQQELQLVSGGLKRRSRDEVEEAQKKQKLEHLTAEIEQTAEEVADWTNNYFDVILEILPECYVDVEPCPIYLPSN